MTTHYREFMSWLKSHPLNVVTVHALIFTEVMTCDGHLIAGLPHMRTALVVGGVPMAHQLHRLRSGVEVSCVCVWVGGGGVCRWEGGREGGRGWVSSYALGLTIPGF